MRKLAPFFGGIGRNSRGASAVEFALLAPVFFGLLFGVFEVGIYMQNYSAMRSLASDAARFAAVEYQKKNQVSATTIEDNVESMGISSPYFLRASQLTVDVTEVTPSIVNGARQFSMVITYDLPPIAGGITIDALTLTYSRPIFVLNS